MFKGPHKAVFRKMFRKQIKLTKYTFAETDDAYGQKERTVSATHILRAEIQEVIAEDLAFFLPGTLEVGDAFGFFLPDYLNKGQVITISAEDEVTWNNKTWRISTIEDFYVGNKLSYKKALMKRVV